MGRFPPRGIRGGNESRRVNRLSLTDRARILACLVDGNSMRATSRITGAAKLTIERLLESAGKACQDLHSARMVNLPCEQIQCDEIWQFVGCKARTLFSAPLGSQRRSRAAKMGWGDNWTWIAIDPVNKLIPAWYVGDRSALSAYRFLRALQPRLAHRVQLTTDGLHAYLVAVRAAFISTSIDYAVLVKLYGDGDSGRYSPGTVTGIQTTRVRGNPDPDKIYTSHVERQNLTVRMSNRRFTRLTNGFSKSIDSHKNSLALHFVNYNFCRIHQSLRVTPAMQAGITDRLWSLEDIARLAEGQPDQPVSTPQPQPSVL